MSYAVNVNGSTTETTNFEAAKNAVKLGVSNVAAALAQPVRYGVLKSNKATNRLNADRQRTAAKLVDGVKLPKNAGDVSGKVGSVSYSITRK